MVGAGWGEGVGGPCSGHEIRENLWSQAAAPGGGLDGDGTAREVVLPVRAVWQSHLHLQAAREKSGGKNKRRENSGGNQAPEARQENRGCLKIKIDGGRK